MNKLYSTNKIILIKWLATIANHLTILYTKSIKFDIQDEMLLIPNFVLNSKCFIKFIFAIFTNYMYNILVIPVIMYIYV